MTDHLTSLLHDEAVVLDVPPAPVDRVLAGGRAIRRRRRTTTAVIGAAVVIVVVAAGVALLGADRADKSPEPASPADRAAYQELGAWADGDQVHVGNHTVTVPRAAYLYYTSVGVVVTSFVDPPNSGDSPTLIRPDGTSEPIALDHPGSDNPFPGDTFATDVTAPYLAYVKAVDGDQGQLTVRDLSTGDETTVGERPFDTHGRSFVYSLWGDQVFYDHGEHSRVVDWRSGERLSEPSADGFVFLQGGYGHGVLFGIDNDTDEWLVTSRTDGRRLLTVPDGSYGSATVSPDGRYLAATTEGGGIDVYTVATGARIHLGGTRVALNYGWSPDGHLVGRPTSRADAEVEVCDPIDGVCTPTGFAAGARPTFVSAGVSVDG